VRNVAGDMMLRGPWRHLKREIFSPFPGKGVIEGRSNF